MERLRQRDFMALLGCIQSVYAIRDLTGFAEQVGSALAPLISSDYYVWAEVDGLARKSLLVASYPSIAAVVPDFQSVFDRYGHENPLLAAHQHHDGALKMSDFISQVQLRRLALYNELFRPGGVHYQMSVVLPAKADILRGVVVNRGRRDFDERERTMLDLVRPHLVQARRNVEYLDLCHRAIEATGNEVVCLDGDRLISYCSQGVASLMLAYFQGSPSKRGRLPEPLDRWVQERQGRFNGTSDALPATQPLSIDRGEKKLVIHFVSRGSAEWDDMLLFEEQHLHVPPTSLTAIGLSPREAEVLSLMTRGRAVAEVSHILAITTSTVEKHLENIYVKLGVHNRAAAIARAFDAQKVWG